MIITCPSCSTKFSNTSVNMQHGDLVKYGDLVKCSVCNYDWVVSPLNSKDDKEINKLNIKPISIIKYSSITKILFIITLLIAIVIVSSFLQTPKIYNYFTHNQKRVENITFTSKGYSIEIYKHLYQEISGEIVLSAYGIIKSNSPLSLDETKFTATLKDSSGNSLNKIPFKVINKSSKDNTVKFHLIISKPPVGITKIIINES